MGQGHSAGSDPNSCKCCRAQRHYCEEASKNEKDNKDINYLVNIKHPPVKRPKIEDVIPPCTVCKQRKIIEE